MHIVSRCLVEQIDAIAANEKRLKQLYDIVGDSNSLKLHQWIHLYALALEYAPDLIIEFGRGYGNSTCIFGEAINQLGDKRRVVSLCFSNSWEKVTLPKLNSFLPEDWFKPLDARTTDILQVDYAALVKNAKRVLIFWDAHGIAIADVILGKLMPLIAKRDHFVAMHDISDGRYCGNSLSYDDLPFWRGQEAGWTGNTARVNLGWVETVVEQAIPVIDFLTRNGFELGSADHQVKLDIVDNPALLKKLKRGYPEGFFETVNHWAYFTLNDAKPPYNFPTYLGLNSTRPQDDESGEFLEAGAEFLSGGTLGSAIFADLERSKLYGRRSPITFSRVLAKLMLGRYIGMPKG